MIIPDALRGVLFFVQGKSRAVLDRERAVFLYCPLRYPVSIYARHDGRREHV